MEQLSNFARTTLNGAINDTVEIINVVDGSVFPDKFFHVVIDPNGAREIVFIQSRTGNALTVFPGGRGSQSTTAASHLDTTQIIHTPLAHNFPTHVNRQTVNNPDIPNLREGSDEFDDGVIHSDWIEVKNPANTSISTWTEGNDVMSCYHEGLDAGSEMIGLIRPMNGLSAPVTIEAALRVFNNYATNYIMWGLVFTDNPNYGSGTQIMSMPYIDTSTAGYRRSFRRATGWVSNGDWGTDNIQLVSPLYNRVRWNGDDTWDCFWSPDGVSWIKYPTTSPTLAFVPTYFGLWLSHWGNTKTTISTWEYFRVY